jgi:RimJ/RimL family protein N-acetyltransferase
MALVSHRGGLARLRDGTEVLIGRVTPADAPRLAEAFARLSEESRRLRFLGPKPSLSPSEIRYLTEVDGHGHEALCAIEPTTGRGVAIGRFVRSLEDPTRAEVAITVADEWQGRGLGTLLLTRLTDRAREEGVERFTALVSLDNANMRRLLGHLNPPPHVTNGTGGIVEYEIELAPRGLGAQLEAALRAAAAGHLQMPPQLCELLRGLVPLDLRVAALRRPRRR